MAIKVAVEPDFSNFADVVRNQLVSTLLGIALDLADDAALEYRIEQAIELLQ